MSKMDRVILGRQASHVDESNVDRFVEGVVKKVTPEGATFTIPDWDDGKHVFGPAPWPMAHVKPSTVDGHTHDPAEPTPGSRCVVVFVGAGVDRPWILGWWG